MKESEEITAPEKGLALERKIYELFKTKGYDAHHDVKREGKSGATHQIDVLANYRCPLHTTRVIVEAKSYEKSINKDIIMKLIEIVDDLDADQGILATTSSFTPGAIKTAEKHGIDMWDRKRLVDELGEIEISAVEEGPPEEIEVIESVIVPEISEQEAQGIVEDILEDRAKGGFLGRGKIIEELESLALLYHPYYEVEIHSTVEETRKTGLLSKEIVEKRITEKVTTDATTGELVKLGEKGLDYPFRHLTQLTDDELIVFRAVNGGRDISALGYSDYKVRQIRDSLVGKGVITKKRSKRGIQLNVRKPYPSDLRLLTSVTSKYEPQESERIDAKTPFTTVDPSAVIKSLESYWEGAKVGRIDTVYYPYFVYVLKMEDGGKRVEALDGIKGTLNEPFSKAMKWDIESLLKQYPYKL